MTTTHNIDTDKLMKVINKMDNLKFAGFEIGNGEYVIIDIEYTGLIPDAKKEGYVFVDVKKHIAANVISKAKIKFSKANTDVVGDNKIRLTVYPPRDTQFGIE